MPYGVRKDKGGDSQANDQKMERCVQAVMQKQGVDKVSAIRICKQSLFGKKGAS